MVVVVVVVVADAWVKRSDKARSHQIVLRLVVGMPTPIDGNMAG